MILYIILMSISLSIDALGIGICYRLKGVSISFGTKVIMGAVSAIIMMGSLLLGTGLNQILPPTVSKIVGVSTLVLIGVAFMRNSLFGGEDTTYDLDHSRNIEAMEGVLLAFALSADSIGAGVAAASTGLSSLSIAIFIGIMQICFLCIGDLLVEHVKFIRKMDSKVSGLFSGILLVVIGVLRWFS